MKKKLMIMLVMVACMSTAAYAKKSKDSDAPIPAGIIAHEVTNEVPTDIKVLAVTALGASRVQVTAIDLSNNEMLYLIVYYGQETKIYRTGITVDPYNLDSVAVN